MKNEEKKLKLFGLLASDPELDLKPLVQELGIGINTLRLWRGMYKKGVEEEKVDTIINLDKALLDKVAEKAAEELALIEVPEPLVVDPATGEQLPESEVIENIAEAKRKRLEVQRLRKERLEGQATSLKDLSDQLNTSCSTLLDRIAEMTDRDYVNVLELETLTDMICKLQTAFFNKNSNNILVLPPGQEGASSLANSISDRWKA